MKAIHNRFCPLVAASLASAADSILAILWRDDPARRRGNNRLQHCIAGMEVRLSPESRNSNRVHGPTTAVASLVTMLLSFFGYCGVVQAADDFRLFTESKRFREGGIVTRCVLLDEGRRFEFIPPHDWSVKPDAGQKSIRLIPEDLNAGIRVKISYAEEEEKAELNSEALRAGILERYPEATIAQEFKCYIRGGQGLAFDIQRKVEKDMLVSCRIAFVTFAGGALEFELTTTSEKFADYHHTFNALLSTFRVVPGPGPAE